jgi:putative ABC transport system permease protein
MKHGSYFVEEDVEKGESVCVIGESDAMRLFGSSDVIGVELDVNVNGTNEVYEVIGVTAAEESMLNYFYDEEPVTLNVPYSSMANYMGNYNEFHSLYLKVDETMDAGAVAERAANLLDIRHDKAGEEFFRIRNYENYMDKINNTLGIMALFVTCVAAIALLVGGIGVMNIMLVSVTERTREIGIRKSLGAKTTSILMQFLSEAAMLTVLGGVIGIGLGLVGAYGMCEVMSSSMEMEIKPGIKLSMILLATLFSCVVGVFFGLYPAKKASTLSPIEALRKTSWCIVSDDFSILVFFRCNSFVLFKHLYKITQVVESRAICDLGDRCVCGNQLVAGSFNAIIIHVVQRSIVGHLLEEATKIFWGNSSA